MRKMFSLIKSTTLLVAMVTVGFSSGSMAAGESISPLSLDDFVAVGCEVQRGEDNSLRLPLRVGQPCTLILQNDTLRQLPEDAWLSFMSRISGVDSVAVSMMFWSDSNAGERANLINSVGLFPGLSGRLSFPLKVLAEGRGVPKTPGTLIPFSFGKGVDITEWSRMALSVMKMSGDEAVAEFSDFRFTAQQPDYPVEEGVVVDAMGQWTDKEWKDKVASKAELDRYLKSEAAKPAATRDSAKYSQYGGTKAKQFKATGFFRTHHDGERWWLVDPEGYAFYSIGIDIIGPGISGNVDGLAGIHEWMPPLDGKYADAWEQQTVYDMVDPGGKSLDLLNFHTANLIRTFGENWHDQWTDITKRRLIEWNVNTVGNWSDLEFARKAKVPYVIPMQDFPVTDKRIFRDFPDVFSTEYERKAEQFAKQLELIKDDPYLIGYFMNNEPGWAYVATINLAETMLEKQESFVTRDRLIEFLSKRYNADIQALNKAWQSDFAGFDALQKPIKAAASLSESASADLQEFSTMILDRYVEVPVKATRAIDPNHLNMGMRWASAALKEEWRFAGTQYLDVFSMNAYTDNPYPRIERAAEMTGKPVLIGEFHHGSMEAGHPAYGARWTRTEAERAVAYRYYAENAASHPSSIGIHYFSFNDDPVMGRFDGQNFHQGFVSVAHKPYSDFIKGYSEVNDELYDVLMGKRKPLESVPEGMIISIPMTFF
ncbi:MAG: beta-galactosidase [Halioglobus sp.]